MSFYPQPSPNTAIFDSNAFKAAFMGNLTEAQADLLYLRNPNAQGSQNFQNIIVNGFSNFISDASFSNIPNSTAVQPATNDSSTKMPNTSWVQSAITAASPTADQDVYLYPQKWYSSLFRINSNFSTNMTYGPQTLTIRFPIPPTGLTSSPSYAFVRVLLTTTIYGNYINSLIGNIFTCSSEIGIWWNLNNNTFQTGVFSNVVSVQSPSTTTNFVTELTHILGNSTNIPIRVVGGVNSFLNFTPVTIQRPAGSTNTMEIVWNQFYTTSPVNVVTASIYGITRTAKIISSSLNTLNNPANQNIFNSITYPNINTAVTTNFLTGTQNVTAYFVPVSTNNY